MFNKPYRSGSPARGRSFGPRRGGSNFGGRSSGPSLYPKKKIRSLDPRLLIAQAQTPTEAAVEFVPVHSFADFDLAGKLKQNIAAHGYTNPTPIQDQAIPELLLGKDVVGIANTGTGKTAAFLLPLISKIARDSTQKVLIVTPTRELAVQILDECRAFTKDMGINQVLCIGGVSMVPQREGLRRRPQIVIGTPGRLKDIYEQRYLDFNDYQSIVLDEVDRMLDMGFIRDIQYIVGKLPTPRQSLFFSATMTPSIETIMRRFVQNPVKISVKSREVTLNVDQDVIHSDGRPKLDVLHDMLQKPEFSKVLIFGRTKFGIEKLVRQLEARGTRVAALHGNKTQSQRQRALNEFKSDRVRVLLATDVASRGLDIPDITHVINFDLPETYQDYVHRIGRTGRANKRGIALSFVD